MKTKIMKKKNQSRILKIYNREMTNQYSKCHKKNQKTKL